METITIYYKEDSDICLRVINWLRKYQLNVHLKEINTITHQEIFRLVYLSNLDIPDILRKTNKFSLLLQKKKHHLKKLRFGESLMFLEQHQELLELPTILSDKHSLSGYDKRKREDILL